MNKTLKTLWALVLMVSLVACGGGGGGGGGNPPPDTTAPVITLSGANPQTVEAGTPYVELGATAFDNVDGSITASIVVTGTVDTNTVGTYTKRYNVSDSSGNPAAEATRTVNVGDTTGPAITVQGANPDSVLVGSGPYADPGATAVDNVDGVRPVVVTGSVDTSVVGSNTLTYTASDLSLHTSTATRTVNVLPIPDTTPPVIALVGADPQIVYVGDTFVPLGATATDDTDGNITANIVTNCNVNTATAGVYSCTYNVSDSSGNPATQVTRTVNVVAVPMLTTGKIYYPGVAPNADKMVSVQNLSTSVITDLWGGDQCGGSGCAAMSPDIILPVRNGAMTALSGPNLDGITLLNLTTLTATQQTTGSVLFDGECSGWPEGSYDINASGTLAILSSRCFPGGWGGGLPEYRAIVMIKLDGTMSSGMHVTTSNVDMVTSPVFGGTDPVSGYISAYFVVSTASTVEIHKQVVDPVAGLPVGAQALVVSDVVGGFRAISFNADYSQFAFMRNVGGVTHVFVRTIATGADVDIAVGVDPFWATDGSNRIMYSVPCVTLACLAAGDPGSRWTVLPDGTSKMQVSIPSNFRTTAYSPVSNIVLGQ